MALYNYPPKESFTSYKAGQKSMAIPIPNLSFNPSANSGAGTNDHVQFGGITQGGGLNFLTLAVLSFTAITLTTIYLKMKK